MVARSPPKLQNRKMVVPPPPPLDPTRIRETVEKVEKSIARLQELQFTVAGGKKRISGVTLSPRSTRGYLKTSLRCKQESLRIKNASSRRSPPGKLPTNTVVVDMNTGDWKRMSLPAMLLGETVGEILQASKFARQIVEAVHPNPKPRRTVVDDDPKTPVTQQKNQRPSPNNLENYCPELRARRRREKQVALQVIRTESNAPPSSSLQRAKSRRINFKVSSPQLNNNNKKKKKSEECDKENCKYIANRVSPRNKPCARKTVLFPNPVFHSSPTKQLHQKFSRTRSPIIGRSKQQSPHKFLIKSPTPSSSSISKFHVKIRSPPLSISPTRSTSMSKKKSPRMMSTAAAKLRRSFSPSRLANRLVSPLKSRKSVHKFDDGMMKMMSGLKQRPTANAMPPSLRS